MSNLVPKSSFIDTSIFDDIMGKLEEMDKVDTDLVDVHVENVDVTLSGIVPDQEAMLAVYDAALQTFGVWQVTNLLLVKNSTV